MKTTIKTKAILKRVGALVKNIEAGVGASEKTREMTAEQFLEHAATEIERLGTDPPEVARKRFATLARAVGLAKAQVWESTSTATLPVMNEKTTANADQSDKEGSLTSSYPMATLFSENGSGDWTAKAEGFRERLVALKDEDGASARAVKATWTTKFINDLPDASFLYIESGGKKDATGKTEPRSKRHFPVKDANGKVDAPHAQDAIGRIPQSDAPGLDATKKKELQDKARKMLEDAKKNSAKSLWPEDLVTASADGDWGAD